MLVCLTKFAHPEGHRITTVSTTSPEHLQTRASYHLASYHFEFTSLNFISFFQEVHQSITAGWSSGGNGTWRLVPHEGPGHQGHGLDRGPDEEVRTARPRWRWLPLWP